MRALVIFGLLWVPGAAMAQDLFVDEDVVWACHADTPVGATFPDCLGVASNQCQDLPGGSTTIGIADCVAAETAIWDDILNAEYRVARTVFAGRVESEGLLDGLRDAQRAWIAFRDADCALAYDRWAGGTIRSVVYANCMMTMTASRAVALRDMAASP